MIKNLTFITDNENKAKYLSEFFDFPVAHKKLDLPEIRSLNLKEIVKQKAMYSFKIIKKPVLAEDVSLKFSCLNSLPGPLINSGIFQPLTSNKVWAEMTIEEENSISHRGKAFLQVKNFLTS